jgi:hypothetical protein
MCAAAVAPSMPENGGVFRSPPGVIEWLEEHQIEVSTFKKIAKLVAGQIHQTRPTAIECLWLIIDRIPLARKLQEPEAMWGGHWPLVTSVLCLGV